ncbi:MAG: NAD(P)/FAD-dependent oxidoreductase [Chloroflexi bacterium]|nr:NAD(P)/FAD-dependent oxidoreductase [Chloroflexota bacterium]
MAIEYDVIIIGGGAGGENVAGRTSPGGLTTVIIESELVGGECSYWACMPSKGLLRPAEALAAARAVPAISDAITGTVDVGKTLRSRNAFANGWNDYWQVKWVESVNANLVRGHARLTGPRAVSVDLAEGGTLDLVARKAVVLATGSSSIVPAIDGIADVSPLGSRDIVVRQDVPESLVILGGGAVGLEMAEAWNSLGAQVTVVTHSTLDDSRRVEPFAMHIIDEAFQAKGINLKAGCAIVSVARDASGVTVVLDNGERITAAELVLAVGRQPNTADLGLEAVGLKPSAALGVNDALQVFGVDGGWLYAVGDVNGRAMMTHQGKYQARQAGDHILGKGTSAWADHVAVPGVIFTDPQIATVGLTESAAVAKGLSIRAIELGLNVGGVSLRGRGIRGGAKWIVDEDRHVLVGVTLVGPEAGELLHAATIAIVGQVPLETLWHAVPAYPTMSEIWLRFLEAYGL